MVRRFCKSGIESLSTTPPHGTLSHVPEGLEVARVCQDKRGKVLVACTQMPIGASSVLRGSRRSRGMDYHRVLPCRTCSLCGACAETAVVSASSSVIPGGGTACMSVAALSTSCASGSGLTRRVVLTGAETVGLDGSTRSERAQVFDVLCIGR